MPRLAGVVGLSPLLRELLRRAMHIGALHRDVTEHRHPLAVLYDELTTTSARRSSCPCRSMREHVARPNWPGTNQGWRVTPGRWARLVYGFLHQPRPVR